MRAGLVNTTNEDADTIRALRRMARLLLCLHLDLGDHALDRVLALLHVPVVKCLLPHEPANISGVSGQTRENHTHVVIDIVDLLLVLRQRVRRHLERDQNLNKSLQC